MTELTGKTIANTYKQLLRVGVSTNTGVSAGLSTIETGDGTDSSFQLATGSAKFTGFISYRWCYFYCFWFTCRSKKYVLLRFMVMVLI